MASDISDRLLWAHAKATIVFNDPVWSEQDYEMQLGKRRRGDYDPPLPDALVDTLRDRQRRLNALHDEMAGEGRETLGKDDDPQAWVEVDGGTLIAARYADRRGIRWVPASVMREFQALSDTPLPRSTDLSGREHG